jgi:microcompartment protein CcmK/EutM
MTTKAVEKSNSYHVARDEVGLRAGRSVLLWYVKPGREAQAQSYLACP